MSFKKIDKARLPNGTPSDTFSSPAVKQQRQQAAMLKLGTIFKKKAELKRQPWQSLIKNLLNSQRGKLPLLLAVEAGNQSMVRELLSSQTAEQLKVSSSHNTLTCYWLQTKANVRTNCETLQHVQQLQTYYTKVATSYSFCTFYLLIKLYIKLLFDTHKKYLQGFYV